MSDGLREPVGESSGKWECERSILGVILRFEWRGGTYVDVSGPSGACKDVINLGPIRGRAAIHPRIEQTQAAFEGAVDEWIKQYPPDALRHDVLHNW
jgi:hypothetical protein